MTRYQIIAPKDYMSGCITVDATKEEVKKILVEGCKVIEIKGEINK